MNDTVGGIIGIALCALYFWALRQMPWYGPNPPRWKVALAALMLGVIAIVVAAVVWSGDDRGVSAGDAGAEGAALAAVALPVDPDAVVVVDDPLDAAVTQQHLGLVLGTEHAEHVRQCGALATEPRLAGMTICARFLPY